MKTHGSLGQRQYRSSEHGRVPFKIVLLSIYVWLYWIVWIVFENHCTSSYLYKLAIVTLLSRSIYQIEHIDRLDLVDMSMRNFIIIHTYHYIFRKIIFSHPFLAKFTPFLPVRYYVLWAFSFHVFKYKVIIGLDGDSLSLYKASNRAKWA